MKFIFNGLFFLFGCFAIIFLLDMFPKYGIIIFPAGLIIIVGVVAGDWKKVKKENVYKGKSERTGYETEKQVNVTHVKNEYNTTINIVQINYNVSLNILGLDPGFGKRELKRARKDKLAIMKQERKQIGFFDKGGKLENRNKVERIEQSYKNLLEHLK